MFELSIFFKYLPVLIDAPCKTFLIVKLGVIYTLTSLHTPLLVHTNFQEGEPPGN